MTIVLVMPVGSSSGMAWLGVAQRMFAVVKLRAADSVLPQPLTARTRQKYVVAGDRPGTAKLVVARPLWLTTMFVKPASVATSSVYEAAPAAAFHDRVGAVPTPVAPSAGETSVGADGAPAVTTSSSATECPGLPLAAPLTVTGYVPGGVAAVAVRVSTALPPGTTGLGTKAAVTPIGSALVDSVTGALKPDWLPTSMVYWADPGAQADCEGAGDESVKSAAPLAVQIGRTPQAMPCASNASQMRHALGVPSARLPLSSSAARNTVYQLFAPQPSIAALMLHWPPEVMRYALLLGTRLPYQMRSISCQPCGSPNSSTSDWVRSQFAELAM